MITSDNYFQKFSDKKNIFYFESIFSNFKQSTQSLIHSESLAFFDINDFSSPFIYFTRIITNQIAENRFTSFLFEFSEIYFRRPNSRSITSLEHLRLITHGYLKIITIKHKTPKLFELFDEEDI